MCVDYVISVMHLYIDHCRTALRTFLETSNMYRPAVVLGKIKDTDLQKECALVYGKVCVITLLIKLHP